jgi:hypothetical protein
MINLENINTNELREVFKKDRSIIIDNFLKEEFAEQLYKYYTVDMNKEFWCATYMPSFRFQGDWEWWQNIPSNRFYIEQAYQQVCNARDNGEFSYFFYKTMPIVMEKAKSVVYDETMTFFNGVEMVNFINGLTELDIKTGDKTFISRYAENCFLSKHTDDINGKLAFVYHLTKDWNPDWGGLYMNLNDSKNPKCICPSFNKLVIFEVADGVCPHSVTQVVSNSNKERISVSGWYN